MLYHHVANDEEEAADVINKRGFFKLDDASCQLVGIRIQRGREGRREGERRGTLHANYTNIFFSPHRNLSNRTHTNILAFDAAQHIFRRTP